MPDVVIAAFSKPDVYGAYLKDVSVPRFSHKHNLLCLLFVMLVQRLTGSDGKSMTLHWGGHYSLYFLPRVLRFVSVLEPQKAL